jgi:hypothetical protein
MVPMSPMKGPQRGYVVTLLIMLTLFLIASALFFGVIEGYASQATERRSDATREVLAQAKEALIAWSALRRKTGTDEISPGHLPCPDDNNDGVSDTTTCGASSTRVGRLPWKTLGLPDLRDASGERLWYAVSRCFLERNTDTYCGDYAVNSDTQGSLNVTGIAPATGVVAIIFSPGLPGAGQSRSALNLNNVAHYLEGENANNPGTQFENMLDSTDTFETRRRCEQTDCPGGAFNDELILITHADLFTAVEEVVAKRIEGPIRAALTAHRDTWAAAPYNTPFHPFAAPFNDPTRAPLTPTTYPSPAYSYFVGRVGQYYGLLPVTRDPAAFSWASISVTETGPAHFDSWPSCVTLPSRALECTIDYEDGDSWPWPGTAMDVTIQARVQNVAGTFAVPIDTAGIIENQGAASSPIVRLSFTQSLDTASGDLMVTYRGRLPYRSWPGNVVTITIPPPEFPAWTDPADPDFGWFTKNRWHQVLYYAVSPDFVLGGAGSCTPLPAVSPFPSDPCLKVQGWTGPGADNDKRVLLVLAGRYLPGGPRAWTIANYFEGQNASEPANNEVDLGTPPNFPVFQRAHRSATFNDKIVVLE